MSHYVDNEKFREALVRYLTLLKKNGGVRVQNRDYEFIGECFLKIAEHVSMKSNFRGYSYRQEMVSDALINCVNYMETFNIEKDNPFSWFTTVCVNACKARINFEEKKTYLKYKSLIEVLHENQLEDKEERLINPEVYENINSFIERFEKKQEEKKRRKKEKERWKRENKK